MADDLFGGLPPPSVNPSLEPQQPEKIRVEVFPAPDPAPPPKPILKSALKRSVPPESTAEVSAPVPKKRLKFKTTTDASEAQLIEAMQKITAHIKHPAKFNKASKLAIQLVQAGSIKLGTSDYFFGILEAAMTSSTPCTDPSVRADYHSLFSAAQDATEHLNKKQNNQLATWTLRAVVANDLYTDDSFVFSKAAGKIKEAISNLPHATEDDDNEEAASLRDDTHVVDKNDQMQQDVPSATSNEDDNTEDIDPFGLDALIPGPLKKNEQEKVKTEAAMMGKEDDVKENKRFFKSQREALITCLETAAKRYKIPWCQTVIDILVKFAFDNAGRFTAKQRDAIGKLWASIREQQARRKQGKSVSGKLDVNAFEWLQEKYANEKISIRHSVGGSGDRRAQQWLG